MLTKVSNIFYYSDLPLPMLLSEFLAPCSFLSFCIWCGLSFASCLFLSAGHTFASWDLFLRLSGCWLRREKTHQYLSTVSAWIIMCPEWNFGASQLYLSSSNRYGEDALLWIQLFSGSTFSIRLELRLVYRWVPSSVKGRLIRAR